MSSTGTEDAQPQQLVIIKRRRGGHDDGHHGGVWKIAYADFMTAMMAFFLVMWLVNSTDEKTIVQVAAYFNPVRLSDKVPSQKGLHDASQVAHARASNASGVGQGQESVPASVEAKEDEKKVSKKEKRKKQAQEQELFANPYDALDRLASQAPKSNDIGGVGTRPIGDLKGTNGQAFRDPYDPIFPRIGSGLATDTRHDMQPDVRDLAGAASDVQSPQKLGTEQGAKIAAKQGVDASARPPNEAERLAIERELTERLQQRQAAQAMAAQLEGEISKIINEIGQAKPQIEVTVTDDGVLISLTDDANFGMFAIGSAEPVPQLVVAMEKIGAILKARDGRIVVRGHTDGRQYRTSLYDNWRLSTARAQMVYYMLVRGGIPEARFERIEGHADRNLRVKSDKDSARNRRIEILLRAGSL